MCSWEQFCLCWASRGVGRGVRQKERMARLQFSVKGVQSHSTPCSNYPSVSNGWTESQTGQHVRLATHLIVFFVVQLVQGGANAFLKLVGPHWEELRDENTNTKVIIKCRHKQLHKNRMGTPKHSQLEARNELTTSTPSQFSPSHYVCNSGAHQPCPLNTYKSSKGFTHQCRPPSLFVFRSFSLSLLPDPALHRLFTTLPTTSYMLGVRKPVL